MNRDRWKLTRDFPEQYELPMCASANGRPKVNRAPIVVKEISQPGALKVIQELRQILREERGKRFGAEARLAISEEELSKLRAGLQRLLKI